MAKSLYSTTEEHTKSARMGRAVVDLGGDVFRSVLSKYVKPDELLGKLQVGRPVRFENIQRELVLDASTTGYGTFDLTLLYKLLRNVAGIDPPKRGWGKPPRVSDVSESDDIERIHNMRNDAYGHITCTRDTGKEWDRYWSELEGVCQRMDERFTNTTFLQDLEFIKTCPMDEQLEKTYTAKLEELIKKEFDLSSRIHDLEDAIKENKDFMESVRRVEQMTLLEIQEHKKSLYVKREKIEETILMMLSRSNKRICIVSGKPGFGKTKVCLEILSHFTFESESKTKAYILKEPAEWRKIMAGDDEKLVLIEDFLGKTNLDENLLQGWERHFTSMEASMVKGNYAIVLSTRDELLQLANQTLKKYGIFKSENVLCISSKGFSMTVEEKKRMLNAYSIRFQHEIYRWMEEITGASLTDSFLLTHKDIDDISHTDPLDGFPQACYLFFTNVTFYKKKLDFFTNATDSVCESVNMLYSPDDRSMYVQYLLLVILMMRNGEHPLAQIEVEDIKSLCNDLEVRYPNSLLIENAIRKLEKSYIRKSKSEVNSYCFTHESILEAVLLSFGKHFPASLLTHADQKVLYDFVRSSQYQRKGREICILLPEKWNLDLVKRVSLAKDLNVANHPTRTDPEFVKTVLDFLELAHTEKKVDNFQRIVEEMLTALCKNNGHVFIEALVNRMLNTKIYPTPSRSILQNCLLENVSSSDFFSLKQILRVLDITSLDKDILKNVLRQAVNKHSNDIDIIKYLLQYTEDKQILLDLALYSLQLSKWKIVRWMSLRSIASDPLQSIFSFTLLNSMNYSKHDMTEKLLGLDGISQFVYDDALELASMLPDPVTFRSLAHMERFPKIPVKTLLNLIWRSCMYKKEEVLDIILLKNDMSKVSLDDIVEIIHKAKASCFLSEEDSVKITDKFCKTSFLPGSSISEKQMILTKALTERKGHHSDVSILAVNTIFEMSAAEIKGAMQLRDRDGIHSSLEIFKKYPVPVTSDKACEIMSKSLLLAFQYGMPDISLKYEETFSRRPLIPDHVDSMIFVCVHDHMEKELEDLLAQVQLKSLQDSTAEVLYLHSSCSKNEHLVTEMKTQCNLKDVILQTGSFLSACMQNKVHHYPHEVTERALRFTISFEPQNVQDTLLEVVDVSELSNDFLLGILPQAMLHSSETLIMSVLKVVCSSVDIDKKVEDAFYLAVKYRKANEANDFISIVGKEKFSQIIIRSCIEESLELYSEEMTTLLVQTFGEVLLTSKNMAQTIRYGSSKFLEVVLQSSNITQSDICDGIFVAVCCEEMDSVQTLVNATDIDAEHKRKIREDLLKLEPIDALSIFQSLETHFRKISPSLQVKEEQFLQAVTNEKTNVVQAILTNFPEPTISPKTMEAGFKDALRNRDEVAIALILSTLNVMDNPIVAKYAVSQAMFNRYIDILPVLLGGRCFPYHVLQEAIQNVILTGGVQQFEILVDHLDKDCLKPEDVVSIFQYIFFNYREGIAELFRKTFDMSLLQHPAARNVVKATISQLSNKMSSKTIMRLRSMHVSSEIINEALLEIIMMALLGRNMVHVKNCLAHLDKGLTPDDTILSILFVMLQNRLFEIAESVINSWNFKEDKNSQKTVKIALMLNAYPVLNTIFNKISEVDDQLFIYVVSESFQRKQPMILKALLSGGKVKYETVLSLYFLCSSLEAEDMLNVISEIIKDAQCDITQRHKENALMLSLALNNPTSVLSVLNNMVQEMSNTDPNFFSTFFLALQEKFKIEDVILIVQKLNPSSLPSKVAQEVLNWSLREADMSTVQSLFQTIELPNEDCLTLKENAIKRFGPIEDTTILYSRTGDVSPWPEWLLTKYQGTAPKLTNDATDGTSSQRDDTS